MPQWPTKDPDAVLDYEINWTAWLNGDTISSSSWTVPAGLTKDSDSFTDTVTKIWLSGGTDSETYTLTNRITTSGGRTDDRSVTLSVASK